MLIEVTSLIPLLANRASEPPAAALKSDRLIEIGEAAALLGYKNSKSLYRSAERYPFVVRDGGRLMFSEKGLHEWIARRTKK